MKTFLRAMAVCVIATSASAWGAGYTDLAVRVKEAGWSDDAQAIKSAKVLSLCPKFRQALPDKLDALSAKDLGAIYLGQLVCTGFGRSREDLAALEKTFNEMERREIATPNQIMGLQSMYSDMHMFDEARAMRRKHFQVNLRDIPQTITEPPAMLGKNRKYYEVSADGKSAELKSSEIAAGPELVYFGSPNCRFSEQALAGLAKDPALKAVLLTRTIFITSDNDFGGVAKWNSAGKYKYRIIYSEADWPGVDTENAPSFNFLVDGKAVCSAHGWFDDKTREEFKNCMEKAGLSSAKARMETACNVHWLDERDLTAMEENKGIIRGEFKKLVAEGAFKPETLISYSSGTLAKAYNLAWITAFSSAVKDEIDVFSTVVRELEKRGLASKKQVETLHECLLNNRRFEEAAAVAARHPEFKIEPLPEIEGEQKAGADEFLVYTRTDSGSKIGVKKLKKTGRQIIVAATPGCHFAQNALEAIGKDKKAAAVLAKHGLFLTDGSDFRGMGHWNESHDLKYMMVYSSGDWPEIDFNMSPTFYFLQDGKVIYTFTGWPKDGKMDELYIGLGRLGFLSND